MGTSNYSDEFKRDAVHQITVRGYPVREVSRRLGVSKYSLYKWVKLFGPVTLSCRPRCSFKPLSVRRRPGFSSPMLSAVDADCRSH